MRVAARSYVWIPFSRNMRTSSRGRRSYHTHILENTRGTFASTRRFCRGSLPWEGVGRNDTDRTLRRAAIATPDVSPRFSCMARFRESDRALCTPDLRETAFLPYARVLSWHFITAMHGEEISHYALPSSGLSIFDSASMLQYYRRRHAPSSFPCGPS